MKGNDEERRGIYLGIWNGIHFELVELLITGRKPPLCSLFILKLKNLILTRNLRFFVEEKYLFLNCLIQTCQAGCPVNQVHGKYK